jgi:hypothetical protein
MDEEAREAREEAAERGLTGRNSHGVRTADETTAVQAALERALTGYSPPQLPSIVPVDRRMMVPLTASSTNRHPRSGRVISVVWTAAANGGHSLRRWSRWEAAQEGTKGGQRS